MNSQNIFIAVYILGTVCLLGSLARMLWLMYVERSFGRVTEATSAVIGLHPVVKFSLDGVEVSCRLEPPIINKYEAGTQVDVIAIKTPMGYKARVANDRAWYRHVGNQDIYYGGISILALILLLVSMVVTEAGVDAIWAYLTELETSGVVLP